MRLRYALPIAVAFLACADDSLAPAGRSYITGRIISREPERYGVRDAIGGVRIDSIPRMLITDSLRRTEPCAQSAYVAFGTATTIRHRSGLAADTAALQVGQRVSVWTDGIERQSCPPQVSAVLIVVEDRP